MHYKVKTIMDAKEQLMEVQSVLDRLTKFRHLNGWAAVAAGCLSILAYFAINIQYHVPFFKDSGNPSIHISLNETLQYIFILGGLLLVSILVCGSIILISLPKDLTPTAWRNLAKLIAVYGAYIISGIAVLFASFQGSEHITLGMLRSIPAMMCIFYGLAQLHAANFSLPALKVLGFMMLACGFAGALLPLYSWFLWALAFGLGHIITGLLVIRNHKS